MPNTKSAERRMRGSARKQSRNHSIKARLHTIENKFAEALKSGKKEEATMALRAVGSAYDKAAKGGVIHARTASRKKSRLAIQLNAKKA
jgi:small subunit ribosomal protein S20